VTDTIITMAISGHARRSDGKRTAIKSTTCSAHRCPSMLLMIDCTTMKNTIPATNPYQNIAASPLRLCPLFVFLLVLRWRFDVRRCRILTRTRRQ